MGFFLRRTGAVLLSLAAASVLICFMVRVLPGDPVAENMKNPTPEKVADARHHLGLDRPWWAQYFAYMGGVLRGDLGNSFLTDESVAGELRRRFPATMELALSAMLLATVGGVALGIFSAARRGTWWDALGTTLSLVGLSVPVFWLGLLAILVGTAWLGWFPASGRLSDLSEFPRSGFILAPALFSGQWEALGDALRHLALPALTLATIPGALIARVTRSSVIGALEQDFIRTARAKGASERRVLYTHALRAAAVPIATMTGVQFAYLLGGAVLTETVFSWPGIGLYVTQSILSRDYPAVQGALLVLVTLVMGFNLLSDALHTWLEPKTRG